ncbi:hypothetical protein FB451DRAFT_1232847 [Mycena latifolia]|nr:hypothetical protein FB451DRAFT_1232847 [Mycena latifolia]
MNIDSAIMDTPFAQFLGTNYCPEDQEIAHIKTLLVEPTRRLNLLDSEIARMKQVMDKLTTERDNLGAYVEAHRALISPFRRIPLDIIQEIFTACLPTHRNCIMSAREAPVLLGRICSSWRALSLSTPHLWARLHIVEPTHLPRASLMLYEEKMAQRLEVAKTWLGRSGQCPLSISLEPGIVLDSDSPYDGLLLRALIPFASRWRHIKFTIPISTADTLSHLVENDVPILQDITIYERPASRHYYTPWTSFEIFRGPKISNFSISSNAQGLSPLDLPLRWSQLTELSLVDLIPQWNLDSSLTRTKALQILSRCSQLRTCRIVVDFRRAGDPSEIAGMEIVECPFLHTLDLQFYPRFSNEEPMFAHLTMPELRHLTLRGNLPTIVPRISPILPASTQLESLDIADVLWRSGIEKLLRGLPPSLQRLEASHLDDDALAALTPSPDVPTPTCPALRDLIILQCTSEHAEVSDEALLHFIDSRMRTETCSRLDSVEIWFSRDMELDLAAKLGPFTDAGLHLSLRYPTPEIMDFSPWLGLENPPRATR